MMPKQGPNKAKTFTCSECSASYELRRHPNPNMMLRCPACKRQHQNQKNRAAKYGRRSDYRVKARSWRLKKYYNITDDDYNKMYDLQGGVCAICKQTSSDKLVIDHNHKTGKVRGLLCHVCNRALGSLKDNSLLLRNAMAYLYRTDSKRDWDTYFIEITRIAAMRSKDPSSQVGAILVKDKNIIATGYNGLPSGVDDNKPERYERPLKYLWMVHGEENAILSAAKHGISCAKATLYVTPFFPCSKCARAIVQAGIERVIVDAQYNNPRYADDKKIALEIFHTAGVDIVEIER